MKHDVRPLFAGKVLAMTADVDINQLLCIRLKGTQNRYPIITYEEAVYTQLNERHIGKILLAQEVMPRELRRPEHAGVWAQYRKDRPGWDEARLLYADAGRPMRMFLHVMNDNSECLVVAGGLDICYQPLERRRYWEVGYRYTDMAPCGVR